MDGKLLSKVTVDRVHSSLRCDVTDSPSLDIHRTVGPEGSRDYVDDILKTETVTNEDVIKIKFTPVPAELLTSRSFTPKAVPQFEYIKDNFEDLHSYKIVNMMCKENKIDSYKMKEESVENVLYNELPPRTYSPLPNLEVPEQLRKIESYLQESLNACSDKRQEDIFTCKQAAVEGEIHQTKIKEDFQIFKEEQNGEVSTQSSTKQYSYQNEVSTSAYPTTPINETKSYISNKTEVKSKRGSVQENNCSIWRAIYNMPIHYHAGILCVILIVYNLIYQYIKENCHGKIK